VTAQEQQHQQQLTTMLEAQGQLLQQAEQHQEELLRQRELYALRQELLDRALKKVVEQRQEMQALQQPPRPLQQQQQQQQSQHQQGQQWETCASVPTQPGVRPPARAQARGMNILPRGSLGHPSTRRIKIT
jgi:hypothetical protein